MSKTPKNEGMVDPRNHPILKPAISSANDQKVEAKDSEQRARAKGEENPPIDPGDQDEGEGLVDPRDETGQPPKPPGV